MNIFKKAAACLAAATVITSVAVTASADYSISIGEGGFEENTNTMVVSGLPWGLFAEDVTDFTVTISFYEGDDDKPVDQSIILGVRPFSCKVVENTGSDAEVRETLNVSRGAKSNNENGEACLDYWVEPIPADDEFFKIFSKCAKAKIDITAVAADGVDLSDRFNSETVEINWNEMATNEPVSEPVNEPASEPVSEPVSEPASESVNSEPVSEPTSSEPSTSQPSNVDTGVTGIAVAVGTAMLAAGAVVVTRRKK